MCLSFSYVYKHFYFYFFIFFYVKLVMICRYNSLTQRTVHISVVISLAGTLNIHTKLGHPIYFSMIPQRLCFQDCRNQSENVRNQDEKVSVSGCSMKCYCYLGNRLTSIKTQNVRFWNWNLQAKQYAVLHLSFRPNSHFRILRFPCANHFTL